MSDSKAKILTAASELFAEKGADGLSVRAISGRAGLSTIGIYNHFNGKQGILDALYIEGFRMVMDAIDVETETQSPRDAVLQGLSNYITLSAEHRGHYQLIFGRADPTYTPSSGATAIGEEAFNRLTALVSRAIPAHLSGREKREAALQLWALAHGYVSLQDHEATELIPMAAWRDLIMNAVTLHLDAVIAKHAG
ncbi:MAG: TetR family transcriptional regulator [Alphaproteobacteria bacterium]|jgi:AcrR family transcriptional regulator|nr:TetR/AcrR family transcriptional regulator [Henriciella sp.]MBO6695270.1 TetR/AcrR family transcriptional regulator [Henriciella sp.]MCH9751233.1 TetR family transcriptional regulator [Alphaproteobacteria bacterium]